MHAPNSSEGSTGPDGDHVFGTQTASSAMAFGLRGIVDWSVQQPFLDVFKTARPWHAHTESKWGAYRADDLEAMGVLDANGWVTEMPNGVSQIQAFILTEMPVEAQYTGGTYRLSFDGEGDITVFGAEMVSRADGEILFDYRPTGNGMVAISINSTDPQNTGNYLRNIEVVKQEHIQAHEAGALFNPLWLDIIDDAHALRFMDWQGTNDSTVRTWSERPQEGNYTYNKGVPVEVMVELANTTGTEPWFNIPWHADATYIREFATYVRDNLNPDLRAHIELSNEVWNWMFDQAQDASEAAQERFGQDLGNGWMQEYGARSAEMARILDQVYDGSEDQLVKVVSTHTYWPGLEKAILGAPDWEAQSPENDAPYLSFDTYAITGYFGNSLGTDTKAGTVLDWISQSESEARQEASAQGLTGAAANAYVAEYRFDLAEALAVRELRDGSVTGNADDSLQGLFELFRYHKSVADAHGLDLVMYEGGTHVVGIGHWVNNETLTEFFTHLNYSDGMGQLYTELLEGWEAAGGTLFNAFVDVSEPSKWGSWGAMRHLEDSTARHDAVVDFMESHPAPAHMKDGVWASTPWELDPVQTPSTPTDPSPEPAPDPEPEPEQGRDINPTAPTEDMREYVFGNTLYVWAVGNPELSVAHWMNQFAEQNGQSYAVAMQTGMLTLHDDLPPNPHISLPTVPEAWNADSGESFADAGFNQITISPLNFIQNKSPDSAYGIDPSTSPTASALRIIEWADARAPGAAINIYETWPHMESFISSFPPSDAEFAAWQSYMNGDWHDWWVSLTDSIRDARPDLDVRLVSAGPDISAMLADPDLGLGALRPADLYVDDGPQGTPTLYLLASMVHYTTVFGSALPDDMELPLSIHPAVVQNFAAIAEWLADNSNDGLPAPIVSPFTDQTEPDLTPSALDRDGTDGDDRIIADGNGTLFNGGAGTDSLVVGGNHGTYSLRFSGDGVQIENRLGDSIPLTARNIEWIEFDTDIAPFGHGSLSVDMFDGMADLDGASMASLTELYIAYFNRAPDAVGLYFWGDQMANGMRLDEIATQFFDQPETRALYGNLGDLPAFVTTVYENVLGRAPDQPGMAYWLDQLDRENDVTPASFIQAILDGAKADTGGHADAAYLANKVLLGGHFAVTRGMSDIEMANVVMQGFDGSDDSLQAGLTQSDAIHSDILDGTTDGLLMQLVGIADDLFGM